MPEENRLKTVSVGRIGENTASQYLTNKGYTILARNYRYEKSEIDIVAQKDSFIIFFEIKTRTFSSKYSSPLESSRPADAVSYQKRKNIIKGAFGYLRENPNRARIRFDVLEIYFVKYPDLSFKLYKINHIDSAFDIHGHIIY